MITQKWCGQTQPHDPHTWAYMPRTGAARISDEELVARSL